MKIELITRHAVANYGSLLQSYASQKSLENLGYDVEILNYIPIEEKGKNIAKSLCKNSKFWNKNILTRLIYRILQTPTYWISFNSFKKMRKKLLKESLNEYNDFNALKEKYPIADIYCAGSDQIWGKMNISTENKSVYFLNFIKDKNINKYSFSSSFGTDKIELSTEKIKMLKEFNTILVREEIGKEYLKEKGFENVEKILDPTLLLDYKEWIESFNLEKKDAKKDYILVYQLHSSKEFNHYLKKLSKQKKMSVIRVSPLLHSLFRYGKLVYLPKLNVFLELILNAKYIVTDSFHGTVFSLIFNKKFIDILPNGTSNRITNLLKLVKQEKRVLKTYNDFSLIDEEIDYNEVNSILLEERKKSIQIVKNSFNKCSNNI